jgi:hypothetical protein
MLFTVISLFGLATITVQNAHAGPKDGGGGFTVKVGSEYQLLDLIENGSSRSPFNPPTTANPKIANYLATIFTSLNQPILDALTNKFSHIHSESPWLAYFILDAMQVYEWKVVSAPLVKLDDIGQSNIDLSQLEIYQGAIRRDRDITINWNILEKMPVNHAVALIFHEIIYAMLAPTEKNKLTGQVYQINFHAREITGILFSGKIKSNGYLKLLLPNTGAYGGFSIGRYVRLASMPNPMIRVRKFPANMWIDKMLVVINMYDVNQREWKELGYNNWPTNQDITNYCNDAYPLDPKWDVAFGTGIPSKRTFEEVYLKQRIAFSFPTNRIGWLNDLGSQDMKGNRSELAFTDFRFKGQPFVNSVASPNNPFGSSTPGECIDSLNSLSPAPADPIDDFLIYEPGK